MGLKSLNQLKAKTFELELKKERKKVLMFGLRRCCFGGGNAVLVARGRLLRTAGPIGIRSYGWNPFVKRSKVVIDESEQNSPEIKEVVLRAKQELRQPLQQDQLRSLLLDLVDSPPNKDSFILINEILRKLEHDQFKSKTPINSQSTPPISTDDAYRLFKIVIDHINTTNFKAARFIPRLYLQLIQVAQIEQNNLLSLQVFNDFTRYLIILGYEDQLLKITNSFISENPTLSDAALDGILNTLKNHHPTPSLTLGLLELFQNDSQSKKINTLVIQSIDYYFSKRNKLYSIDQHNLDSIQQYIEKSLETNTDFENLHHLLKLCQKTESLTNQETLILTKSINYLLNNKDYICEDYQILNIFTDSFIQNNVISYQERKIAGEIMLESFKKSHENFELSKNVFDLFVKWDVFQNTSLTKSSENFILDHQDFVDDITFKEIIKSMSFAPMNNFNDSIASIYEFFQTNFPNLDKTIDIYSLLLQRGIRLNDSKFLTQTFIESLNDGILWESNPKILYDFIYTLAIQPNANVKQVFHWYEKIKISVKHLDSKSYNSLMKLFLQNELIGDAIESLKRELPPLLDKDTKYSVDQYPELFQSMYDWILEFNGDPEVSWTLYCELQKYFHVPFDTYFPLMQKFASLKRPDASFMIFQKLKKIHRTTGSIPPPTPEMYCFLFNTFGKELYEDGVKNLHIIMKLDLQLNTDIDVMNSLLGAYCNLQEYFRTQEIFDSIISMPKGKGLNNETISIMLKSYTYVSLSHVKSFWDNIYEYDILPNEDNFKQYIIAHCYHEQYDLALQITMDLEKDFDLLITPDILKSLYNWTQGEENKLKIAKWASKEHKLIWTNIEKEQGLVEKPHTESSHSNSDVREIETKLIHESAI